MALNTNKAVASALRTMREQKGHTRVEVAQALHTTETTVYRWERGDRTPDLDNLRNLAAAYQCDVGDFLPHDDMRDDPVEPRPGETLLEARVRALAERVTAKHNLPKGDK